MPSASTAGLSKAYAVLRQLELLRQQDILNPIPLDDTCVISSSSSVHRSYCAASLPPGSETVASSRSSKNTDMLLEAPAVPVPSPSDSRYSINSKRTRSSRRSDTSRCASEATSSNSVQRQPVLPLQSIWPPRQKGTGISTPTTPPPTTHCNPVPSGVFSCGLAAEPQGNSPHASEAAPPATGVTSSSSSTRYSSPPSSHLIRSASKELSRDTAGDPFACEGSEALPVLRAVEETFAVTNQSPEGREADGSLPRAPLLRSPSPPSMTSLSPSLRHSCARSCVSEHGEPASLPLLPSAVAAPGQSTRRGSTRSSVSGVQVDEVWALEGNAEEDERSDAHTLSSTLAQGSKVPDFMALVDSIRKQSRRSPEVVPPPPVSPSTAFTNDTHKTTGWEMGSSAVVKKPSLSGVYEAHEGQHNGAVEVPPDRAEPPLMSYIRSLDRLGSSRLMHELAAMGDTCACPPPTSNTSTWSADACVEDCVALTVLMNKPGVLRWVVSPMVVSCLLDEVGPLMLSASQRKGSGSEVEGEQPQPLMTDARGGATRSSEDAISQLLRVLVGLGVAAAGTDALPVLLECLQAKVGNYRLLGMAVRAVGGEAGIHALNSLLATCPDDAVRTAAAYALSTLSRDTLGHTTVICSPDPQLLLAPMHMRVIPGIGPAARELCEVANPLCDADEEAEVIPLQKSPEYRQCNLVLYSATARELLMKYANSAHFKVDSGTSSPSMESCEMCCLLAEALANGAMASGVNAMVQHSPYFPLLDAALTRVKATLGPVLTNASLAFSSALLPMRVLRFSYSTHFAKREEVLFAVEQALVTAFLLPSRASSTLPLFASPASRNARVQEQALLSLASLPARARMHAAQPVYDCVARLARRLLVGRDSLYQSSSRAPVPLKEVEVAVLVAGAVALGAVVGPSSASMALTSQCQQLLIDLIEEDIGGDTQWRVRHGACIGLGLLGNSFLFASGAAPDGMRSSAAALVRSLESAAVAAGTGAWALVRQGRKGIEEALQLLVARPAVHPLSLYVACARALADAPCWGCTSRRLTPSRHIIETELLSTVIQALGTVIVSQGSLEEEAVVECVYALARMVDRAAVAATTTTREIVNLQQVMGSADKEELLPVLRPGQYQQEHSDEAILYYGKETPNDSYVVLKSIIEAAVLPYNVLKALFLTCCRYGGAHGEVYATQAVLESARMTTRAAAAYGLRACGAKVIRTFVVALNDPTPEVRAEALSSVECLDCTTVVRLLSATRPRAHKEQVMAALRDCLLRDASRGMRQSMAQVLYTALVSSDAVTAH